MYLRFIIILFFSFSMNGLFAQDKGLEAIDFGIQINAFQHGWQPGICMEYPLDIQGNHVLNASASLMYADLSNFGKHQEETIEAEGLGLGYRYYPFNFAENFFIGLHTDYWWSTFKYADEYEIDGTLTTVKGESKVQTLLPKIELGYKFIINKGSIYINPNISYGIAKNISIEGEDVAEESQVFIGFGIGLRL